MATTEPGPLEGTDPFLSVIVLTLNSERYVEETLQSIPRIGEIQTVVVDGGSSDGTLRLVRDGFPQARVVLAPGTTIPQSRNLGLREATGEYVLFLDSDEILIRNGLESVLERLRRDRPSVGVAGVRLVDASGHVLGERQPRTPDRILDLFGNPWPTSGIACRREDVLRVGGFSEAFELAEDYDLWLRLFETRPALVLDAVVADHRIHGLSVSHQRGLRLVGLAMKASFSAARRRRVGGVVRLLLLAYWAAWHLQPNRWSSQVRHSSSGFPASLLQRIASREDM